jgi:D-lactate dehydrogenase
MKIAFFELKAWEIEIIKKSLKKHRLIFFEDHLNEKNIKKIKDADAIAIFIGSKLDKTAISKLPKLKFIATMSTGYDHIDLDECRKKRIAVSNVPHYGENTVAEHTFALILALSRKIHLSYLRTLQDNFSLDGITGFDLKGKTIGIIGGGNIGMNVLRIAKGFEMNVLLYDITKDRTLEKKLGFSYVSIENLMKNSDIVSLHVPYNKYTHHIIDKDKLRLMKKSAVLINTARGSLVDTNALLWALENKIIGGAGLDVIEGEDLIKDQKEVQISSLDMEKWKTIYIDHKIFRMENVVFTPHNAFNSKEALSRIIVSTVENINAFRLGKPTNLLV